MLLVGWDEQPGLSVDRPVGAATGAQVQLVDDDVVAIQLYDAREPSRTSRRFLAFM